MHNSLELLQKSHRLNVIDQGYSFRLGFTKNTNKPLEMVWRQANTTMHIFASFIHTGLSSTTHSICIIHFIPRLSLFSTNSVAPNNQYRSCQDCYLSWAWSGNHGRNDNVFTTCNKNPQEYFSKHSHGTAQLFLCPDFQSANNHVFGIKSFRFSTDF